MSEILYSGIFPLHIVMNVHISLLHMPTNIKKRSPHMDQCPVLRKAELVQISSKNAKYIAYLLLHLFKIIRVFVATI